MMSNYSLFMDTLFSNNIEKQQKSMNKILESPIKTVLDALRYAFDNFNMIVPKEYVDSGEVPMFTLKRDFKLYIIKKLKSGVVDYNRLTKIFNAFEKSYNDSERSKYKKDITRMLTSAGIWVDDYVGSKSKNDAARAIDVYMKKIKGSRTLNESKKVISEAALRHVIRKLISENTLYVVKNEPGYEYKKGKSSGGDQYWLARKLDSDGSWGKEFKSTKLDQRAEKKASKGSDKLENPKNPPKKDVKAKGRKEKSPEDSEIESALSDKGISGQMQLPDYSEYYEAGDTELVKRATSANLNIGKSIIRLLSGIVLKAAQIFVPLPADCLLEFLAYRKKRFKIKGSGHRRAMYYTCKAAEERQGKEATGSSLKIHYKDYYNGQKLDPKARNNIQPIIHADKAGSPPVTGFLAKFLPANPYQGLSITIGKAMFKKLNNGGYIVGDRYDFNIIRSTANKPTDYVLTVANAVAGKTRAAQKLKDSKTKSGIEEYMVWRELKDNYKGYEITCQTKSKKSYEKAEEKAKEKQASRQDNKGPSRQSDQKKSKSKSGLPQPKKLSWINVTSVSDKSITGILAKKDSAGKTTYSGKKVTYKAGTTPYKNTLSDLKK